LSRARNRGISESSHPLIAWTDDDVIVDVDWARRMAEAFDLAPDVDLVTGLILPLELDTPAQVWRELRRGYGKGFARRVWRGSEPPADQPLFPYTAGRMGSGANMAARSDFLERVSGFDPALGAGSPTGGGEDLDLLLRAILVGSAVAYEPAAMIFHRHHDTFDALVAQTRDYGRGLAAYLAKWLVSDRAVSLDMLRRAPSAVVDYVRTGRAGHHPTGGSSIEGPSTRRIAVAEVRGLLGGAYSYIRSARRSRVGWVDRSRGEPGKGTP
jgi:GT2 family glycosyltransferase